MDFYRASSLEQQFTDRLVDLVGHIIPIPNQQVFAISLNAAYTAENQQIPISVFCFT